MKKTKATISQQARSRVALERHRCLISEEKKKQRDYLDPSFKLEQAASAI